MNDPRDDREFEAWLAGDSPVSEAYRQTAAEQPPTELDARVLAAAEQELKVVPIRAARRWRRRGAAGPSPGAPALLCRSRSWC